MKRTAFPMSLLIAMFLISCQKDEIAGTKDTGSLLLNIESALQVREIDRHLKASPAIENFKVTICHPDGSEVLVFDSTTVRPDTIELEVGDYYVEAHSDNNLAAAFENPYYYGISDIFSIGPNVQQSVLVNCVLANTIVSVTYSQQLASNFTDYHTTVASELDSLVYQANENRKGYFRTLPLSIRVWLSYEKHDGTVLERQMTGSIPYPMANRHYEIVVDASLSDGLAAFQVLLDSTEAPIEVIEIVDGPGSGPEGAYAYGDLIITELMYNPAALSDTEGEWFEIYNNSDQSISMQNLILGRDDANRHTVMEPIDLLPGDYLVLERNDVATSASPSYTYGSEILLPNSGAIVSIYNEGTETHPGSLIFSVNYGDINFPDTPGASISLGPDRLTAAEAVLGTSWCISSSIFGTGDLGTPGELNDACQ